MTDIWWIIGVDPSMTGTAIGGKYGGAYTVPTATADGDKRLRDIYDAVRKQCDGVPEHTMAVVEDLPTHARSAGITGMVQGVVRLALMQSKVAYVTVPPATLKKFATGKGNATKADMRMAWFKRTGEDIRDDNKVDALWLRQIGLHGIGHAHAIELPKAQRECILKLAWPEAIAARLLVPYEKAVAG